eukprot:TRINITY_DN5667_c0_g1_i1.p1 TRINITY_DN5667_c0_g1~~TRINITY_DN5667_c0_g1_i1.p1  ORF type:complete len:690 (-),score=92.68 TRINITY_DN5667_c0_g1_i1:90-1937(-)
MAVVAQAVLSALSEPNCVKSNTTCSIKVDDFSMITGVSGGGWGIGLYANNNTKPDRNKIGDFSYRNAVKLILEAGGNPLLGWRKLTRELVVPAGITDNMHMTDQPKAFTYIAAAFDADDAERPELISYSRDGYCLLHRSQCRPWKNATGMSVEEVMFRTGYFPGCTADVMRLPPYSLWKESLRLVGRKVRPKWFTHSFRDEIGKMVGVGLEGAYEPLDSTGSDFPGFYVSDGGLVDNSAMLAALAAKASRVITVGLYDGQAASDLVDGGSQRIYIPEELSMLFGIVGGASLKGNYVSLNHVFEKDAIHSLVNALAASVDAGLGGVATVRLRTVENKYWHIEGGRLVTFTVVLLHGKEHCKNPSDPTKCILAKYAKEAAACEIGLDTLKEAVEDLRDDHFNRSDNRTFFDRIKDHFDSVGKWFEDAAKSIKPAIEGVLSHLRPSDVDEDENSDRGGLLKAMIFNSFTANLVKPLSTADVLLSANTVLGNVIGLTGLKDTVPKLPLLLPNMNASFKAGGMKCADATFRAINDVVKRSFLHFTPDPFSVAVQREAARTAALKDTFIDLQHKKCTTPDYRCAAHSYCRWRFGNRSYCGGNWRCQCRPRYCFRDGKCQGL